MESLKNWEVFEIIVFLIFSTTCFVTVILFRINFKFCSHCVPVFLEMNFFPLSLELRCTFFVVLADACKVLKQFHGNWNISHFFHNFLFVIGCFEISLDCIYSMLRWGLSYFEWFSHHIVISRSSVVFFCLSFCFIARYRNSPAE